MFSINSGVTAQIFFEEEEEEEDSTSVNDDDMYLGGEFIFGIRAGITSARFSHNFSGFTERKSGFAVGGTVKYMFADYFGASVELLYQQEGGNELLPDYLYQNVKLDYSNKVNSNVTLHTLQLPVYATFTLPDIETVKPYLTMGISYDYIFKAYSRDLITISSSDGRDIVLDKRSREDVSSVFKPNNISALIGCGISFETDFSTYSIDIRYKAGLMKINNLGSLNINNTFKDDFSYNSILVSLGLTF